MAILKIYKDRLGWPRNAVLISEYLHGATSWQQTRAAKAATYLNLIGIVVLQDRPATEKLPGKIIQNPVSGFTLKKAYCLADLSW
jgi:hypothetical protein